MSKHSHFEAAKAFVGLLIVALVAGIFLLFYKNSEAIIEGNQFKLFMTLAVVGAGLLIGLLYLVSNSQHTEKATTHKTHKKKKSSK